MLAGLLCALLPGPVDAQPATTRVSEGSWGIQANHHSNGPSISADGRWVAFESRASNLVADDSNNTLDVFVHDRQTGTTTRVSVRTGGVQGNDVSVNPAISADGRWVAFESWADYLVEADTNMVGDLFLHDRTTGTTTRVSVGPGGTQADQPSGAASISADGRVVAFQSAARNLVADDTNDVVDSFVYDRDIGITARVSVATGSVQGNQSSGEPAISADGRWVAFTSLAGNLVADDTNGVGDTFVHDRLTGETTRVSVGPGGVQGNDWSYSWPAISGDGRRVAFQSAASNLVLGDSNGQQDVFVHDRETGTTTRISVGPGQAEGDRWSEFPAISTDGRWVLFASAATNLVARDSNGVEDVFAYDLQTGTLTRVSLDPMDAEGDSHSSMPAVNADGRWVAFASGASNLVASDTNGLGDIFVRDLVATAPVAPTGLVVEAVTGNLVTLRWTAAAYGPAATSFMIEGGANPGEVLASIPTRDSAPSFSFAAPAGSFYVRVHALNDGLRSAASNEVRIHVSVPVPPSAPAHLLALVNRSTLSLSWTSTYAGGAPTSLVLEVTGSITTSLPLGVGESFSFDEVPPGTYTLALRAQNAAGSSPASNAVTLTFPGPCSGPPLVPTDLRVHRVGHAVNVAWAPATSGPAPTAYILLVTGSEVSSFITTGRTLSGEADPGVYAVSVVAANVCGASAGTPPLRLVVP
jgi:Tol biopolymer transport system component